MEHQHPHIASNPHAPFGQQDLLDNLEFAPPENAGFWLRTAAFVIDLVIVWAAAVVVFMPIYMINENAIDIASLIMYPLYLLYYPIMESSRHQATFGKKAVGIIVTSEQYKPISFINSVGRNAGKILSSIIIYVGYMMAGWTEKKQALHDMLAHTLVVKK